MEKLYRVFIGLSSVPRLLTNTNHKRPYHHHDFPTHATQVCVHHHLPRIPSSAELKHAHIQLLFSFQLGPSGFSRGSFW
jgi:hypothetical protein